MSQMIYYNRIFPERERSKGDLCVEKKTKRGFYLKWPYNVVVYVVLVVVLRIFAIPVILLIMHWNKKQQPNGPEEGYCLDRTRKRLGHVLWSPPLLLIGAGLLVFGWMSYKEQSEGLLTIILSGVLGCVALASGIYVGYINLRDSLFPEKSTLAKSIRSQLPYPDEAPPVKELFAMVDDDLRANGQWFDRVGVGQQWVLGDEANYIPRIRAVFGRDEIKTRHSSGGTRTTRVIQIYIVDDRNQIHITDLLNPRELPMLMDCLRLRVPEAYFDTYAHLTKYTDCTEEQKQRREVDFKRRKGEREQAQQKSVHTTQQNMILHTADGGVTSRIEPNQISELLEKESFSLVAGRPVEAGGVRFTELRCVPQPGGMYKLMVKQDPEQDDQPTIPVNIQIMARPECERVVKAWMQGKVPDLTGWKQTNFHHDTAGQQPRPREKMEPMLRLISHQGVQQSHCTFTREDIQVAVDGLVDGSYHEVQLYIPQGFRVIEITTGTKLDGRCTVLVSRIVGTQLRYYEKKCTHRQAADWLMETYLGTFRENLSDWRECTKKITR